MKINLKKLKIVESMSEETICFTADVYRDGKLIGHAKNHGHGGSTDITSTIGNRIDMSEYDALERAVDDIVYEEYNKKEKIRVFKKIKNQILKHKNEGSEHVFLVLSGHSHKIMAFPQDNSKDFAQRVTERIKMKISNVKTITCINLNEEFDHLIKEHIEKGGE